MTDSPDNPSATSQKLSDADGAGTPVVGASRELLARFIARELSDTRRVWVAPELTTLRSLVSPETIVAESADIAVLSATLLGESGGVAGSCGAPRGARVWAVLETPMRIVQRCKAPVASVERAFGHLGVLEVTQHGLVIVALARGTSAKDMQELAEPTLKISSRVAVMRDNVPNERETP